MRYPSKIIIALFATFFLICAHHSEAEAHISEGKYVDVWKQVAETEADEFRMNSEVDIRILQASVGNVGYSGIQNADKQICIGPCPARGGSTTRKCGNNVYCSTETTHS
jgi:hypothetical protein